MDWSSLECRRYLRKMSKLSPSQDESSVSGLLKRALNDCLVNRWFFFEFGKSEWLDADSRDLVAKGLRLADEDAADFLPVYSYLCQGEQQSRLEPLCFSQENLLNSSFELIVDTTVASDLSPSETSHAEPGDHLSDSVLVKLLDNLDLNLVE